MIDKLLLPNSLYSHRLSATCLDTARLPRQHELHLYISFDKVIMIRFRSVPFCSFPFASVQLSLVDALHLASSSRHFAGRRTDLNIERQRFSVVGKPIFTPRDERRRDSSISLAPTYDRYVLARDCLPGDDLSPGITSAVTQQGSSNVLPRGYRGNQSVTSLLTRYTRNTAKDLPCSVFVEKRNHTM